MKAAEIASRRQERDARILAAHRRGVAVPAIASSEGISEARVYQITREQRHRSEVSDVCGECGGPFAAKEFRVASALSGARTDLFGLPITGPEHLRKAQAGEPGKVFHDGCLEWRMLKARVKDYDAKYSLDNERRVSLLPELHAEVSGKW